MRSKRFVILFLLANIFVIPLAAQECKDIFNQAEKKFKQGNYNKALTLYRKTKECGDAYYRRKSEAKVQDLVKVINDQEAIKSKSENRQQQYIIVPSLIYLPSGTEEQTIKVASSGNWRVKEKPDIINVTKKNSKTLTISSVSQNISSEPRRTTFTVECGEITRTITVEQDGVPEVLEYKSKYMKIPYNGGDFIVDLNTNTKWKVDAADWYKAVPDTANNDSTRMIIKIDKNIRNEDRHGTIIVRSESGNSYDVMEIYQYANEYKIFSPVDSIIDIAAKGDTICVPIISDNDKWTISGNPTWCAPYKVNKDTLKMIVLPNTVEYMMSQPLYREGLVTVKSGDGSSNIWIRQQAPEFHDPFAKKVLGGRDISIGLTAGYVMPFVNSTSSGTYTGSVINYSLGNSNEDVNYSSETGFTVGAIVDFKVHKNWYIKTGVDYTHLQYTNSFDANVVRAVNQGFNATYYGTFENTFKEKYKFDVISIPVLASYRFVFDKWNNLQVDLGPVVSFALSGKMSFDGNSRSGALKLYNSFTGETGEASPMSNLYAGEMNLYDTKMTNTSTSSYGGISRDFLKDRVAIAAPYNRVSLGLRLGVVYEYAGLQVGLTYTQMLTDMANSNFWKSSRMPVFGQTSEFDQESKSYQSSEVLIAGYKQIINTLTLKVGYIFRHKK